MVVHISRLFLFQCVLIMPHLVADLFLYSYDGDFIINKKKHFNFTFHYIDHGLSLNDTKFCDYFDVNISQGT